jgi:hypothetical protein
MLAFAIAQAQTQVDPKLTEVWEPVAPAFSEDGAVVKPAYVTVVHNGVLVQDHVEIRGSTAYRGAPSYVKHNPKEPLVLQDHGNAVSYRNIWIREL